MLLSLSARLCNVARRRAGRLPLEGGEQGAQIVG